MDLSGKSEKRNDEGGFCPLFQYGYWQELDYNLKSVKPIDYRRAGDFVKKGQEGREKETSRL